ncbi:hypothetical protein SCLCIDRAFT_199937 [Scleroderma citrinum Foug A]|uniref:Uncharacterized protein n=1 Tax=Scleroderma citrinum Foug A TaxID=1036808 RepID=A0A0C3DKT6_9AGAM|nr:hypothetical protein SCLCIDRAFT_199937 [Scleroderma citrinum Foug A]
MGPLVGYVFTTGRSFIRQLQCLLWSRHISRPYLLTSVYLPHLQAYFIRRKSGIYLSKTQEQCQGDGVYAHCRCSLKTRSYLSNTHTIGSFCRSEKVDLACALHGILYNISPLSWSEPSSSIGYGLRYYISTQIPRGFQYFSV